MLKVNYIKSFTYTLFSIFIVCLFLNIYQYRFLLNSYKINSRSQQVPLINLLNVKNKDFIINQTTRVILGQNILPELGYTISFDIKTKKVGQKDSIIFYSTDKSFNSIYRNVSLIDGKIETSRLEYVIPIITNKKINDGQWHKITITTNNNEEKIFIDSQLDGSTIVNYLKTPDKWFVININQGENGLERVYIRDFLFINRDHSPQQLLKYEHYFNGETKPLIFSIIANLIANYIFFLIIWFILILFIKHKYSTKTYSSIIINISHSIFLMYLWVFSFYVNLNFQASLILLIIFVKRFSKVYYKIFPSDIILFVNFPYLFLTSIYSLIRKNRFKEVPNYIFSQKAEFYLILFIFLGLLFSFNQSLFTYNLFK